LFEEFSNSYRNNLQEIEDLLDEIIELQGFGKEEYTTLLERVASAIKKAGEMEIE
jgi:dsDNA-specific endonuclease/ATPase MutS2